MHGYSSWFLVVISWFMAPSSAWRLRTISPWRRVSVHCGEREFPESSIRPFPPTNASMNQPPRAKKQTLTRRRLLRWAAASGACFFQAPAILRAAGFTEDRFGDWPIGVQSYSLRNFSMLEAVRHIQGMGVHYVEMYSKHLPLEAEGESLHEVLSALRGAEITLSAHGVSSFNQDHQANRQVFEFAKRAGVKNITANPEPAAFDSLDKLVAEYDVRICIHNHGPGALYDSIASVQQAVQGRHKNIGACVNTGHFLRSNEDPVKAVRELGPRVFAVHIKDEAEMKKNSHNVVIGTGHLDLVGLFRALKQVKFPLDGALSLEYEANPQNPIDDMKQCLVMAAKAIAEA